MMPSTKLISLVDGLMNDVDVKSLIDNYKHPYELVRGLIVKKRRRTARSSSDLALETRTETRYTLVRARLCMLCTTA